MNDYDSLKATIVRWLNREGFQDLIDEVDIFLVIAQNRVYREIDFHFTEKTLATVTTVPQTLPADFDRMKSVTIGIGESRFEVNGSPEKLVAVSGTLGRPLFYSTSADGIEWGTTPDQEFDVTLSYWSRPENLGASNTSNWITINAPELLLFGSLLEASLFLKDDQRAQVWLGRYGQIKQEIENAEERRDKEPGGLSVREQIYRYSGSKRIY
jgi:hypothetical protein